MAEKYNLSRRQSRRIASAAYLLIKDDVQEGDLNRPEMTAKLMATLEAAMYKAMKEKQYAAVGSNAKVLMRLIGLDTQNINHQHGFKHGRSTSYFN